MHPQTDITNKYLAKLDDPAKAALEKRNTDEDEVIKKDSALGMLKVRKDEAINNWNRAYDFLKQKGDVDRLDVTDPEVVKQIQFLGFQLRRYFSVLSRMDDLHKADRLFNKRQFWIIVVGGFLIAIIATVYTVLAYYKNP